MPRLVDVHCDCAEAGAPHARTQTHPAQTMHGDRTYDVAASACTSEAKVCQPMNATSDSDSLISDSNSEPESGAAAVDSD